MRRPVSPRCLCLVVDGVIAQWFSNWRGDQRAVLTGQLCCPPYCLARRVGQVGRHQHLPRRTVNIGNALLPVASYWQHSAQRSCGSGARLPNGLGSKQKLMCHYRSCAAKRVSSALARPNETSGRGATISRRYAAATANRFAVRGSAYR